jgi:hypothetical protein
MNHPDWTAVAVGLPLLVGSLLWVLDLGGVPTRILRAWYKRLGSVLWPSGSEESYVSVMRWGGLFALVVAVLMVIAGIAR